MLQLFINRLPMNTFDKYIKKAPNVLHFAVRNNALHAVIFLLKWRRGMLTVQDVNGHSPLHLAIQNKHSHIAALLLQYATIDEMSTICEMRDTQDLSLLQLMAQQYPMRGLR